MENAAKNIFIAGLPNAHSMEIQARELMELTSLRASRTMRTRSQAASACASRAPLRWTAFGRMMH